MMKKTLVALAVLGASGLALAQAQAPVTVYGVADAGIGRSKFDDGFTAKTKFTNGTTTVNNGDSRVGFTGLEDLGNGTKVGFQFETGIGLDDGHTTGAAFWQRQANVFVSGGWGTVKMGRQFTPSFLAQAAYELTGLANYSAVVNSYGVVGMGFRASSAIAYVSPDMNGFQAVVAFVSKHNGTPNGKSVWDAGVTYNNGPLGVGASVNKGLDGGKTNYQLGAKYGFGNCTVAASYHSVSDNINPLLVGAPEGVRRGFSLGASAKMGAFTVTADFTRDHKREEVVGGRKFKGKKYTNAVLEAKYDLSKRTFLYADFLRLEKTNNWGVGIHHSF